MNLKIETKNDILIIFVREERLDAHNSGDLKTKMQELFTSGTKYGSSTARGWVPWYPASRTQSPTRGALNLPVSSPRSNPCSS